MDDGSNVTIESNTTINGAEFWITEGRNVRKEYTIEDR